MKKDIFEKLQLMGLNNLYDRFDFDKTDLEMFQKNFNGIFLDFKCEKFTIKDFINYSKLNKHDAHGWLKKIPMNYKIRLMGKCKVDIMKIKQLEVCFMIYILISDMVLQEIFDLKPEVIDKFNDEMLDYIDSYVRRQPKCKEPYLKDSMIIEMFKDELNLNVKDIIIEY